MRLSIRIGQKNMHAAITTVISAIETIPVEVQVQAANGLPAMAIVGLADKAVAESRERCGRFWDQRLVLPPKRIAVNWHRPMWSRKVRILTCRLHSACLLHGCHPVDAVANMPVLGELSLRRIEPVTRVLPLPWQLSRRVRSICPAKCGSEAAQASDLTIIAPPDLMALLNHLRGAQFRQHRSPNYCRH